MDVPDPEQAKAFGGWIAGAATFFATLFGIYKVRAKRADVLDDRFDRKADKHTVANQLQEVKAEVALHRGYFKDVFQQMRENEQRAQDRHERLLERLPK